MAANTDDPFRGTPGGIESPASDAFAVTPSDAVKFAIPARALYIGGTGDVTLLTALGTVVLFSSLPAGFILPVRCLRVNATATSATSIVGLV